MKKPITIGVIAVLAVILLIPTNAFARQFEDIVLSANYSIVEEGDIIIAVVDVVITNNSNKPFELYSFEEFVIDDQERKFSINFNSDINRKYNCEIFTSNVNPGLTKYVKFCFEIPSNTSLSYFQLSQIVGGKITASFPKSPETTDELIENEQENTKIPDWVKNTMKWFVEGKISEKEMISALEFLIREGIIQVGEKLEEIEKNDGENEYEVLPREWQTSGPFQLDRNQYALGEKIFLRIDGLDLQDKGQIAVMRPLNSTHYSVYLTIPFDGEQQTAFNYYLDPQLSKTRGLCSVDDVMGKWALVFRGTNYPNLNFEITDKILPGTDWNPVC